MKIEVGDLIEITVVSKVVGYFCSLKDDVITISTCDDLEMDRRIGVAKERVANIKLIGSTEADKKEELPGTETYGNLLPFKPRDPKVS